VTRQHDEISSPRAARTPIDWAAAAVVLAVFLIVDHLHEILSFAEPYRQLRGDFPFYVRSSIRNALQVGICLFVIRMLWATNALDTARQLGIVRRVPQGFAFGLAASAPMLVGFALASSFNAAVPSIETAYLAGVSPLTEELVYRGFACGFLYSRARLPAWIAIGLPGLIFGWGHVEQVATSLEGVGLFLLVGLGGVAFGWFYLRWRQNIWVPFAVHALGNFWWELFDVSDNALGGWYAFSLQLAMLTVGTAVTLRWTSAIARPSTPS
jgi:CAAX protease family protein